MRNIISLILFLLLCSSAVAQSGTGVKLTPVRATIAYTALTNSYVDILVNTRKLQACTLTNATNAAVSWDDSAVPFSENQASFSKEFHDFSANNRFISTTIRIKYTVSAPTAGNIFINCYY